MDVWNQGNVGPMRPEHLLAVAVDLAMEDGSEATGLGGNVSSANPTEE